MKQSISVHLTVNSDEDPLNRLRRYVEQLKLNNVEIVQLFPDSNGLRHLFILELDDSEVAVRDIASELTAHPGVALAHIAPRRRPLRQPA